MEPTNKLVLWMRVPFVAAIMGLVSLVLHIAATVAGIAGSRVYALVFCGLCLIGLFTIFLPVRQRIRLICDGKEVVLTTLIGIIDKPFQRVQIRWDTKSAHGKLQVPEVFAASKWINMNIGEDGAIPLRIYKPPLKSYFMVFPGTGLKEFEAQSNSYLWLWDR